MPLNPEQQAELLKFLNLEEAESLDQAKEKFQSAFLPVSEHQAKIGKITGSITSAAKKAFSPFGVSLGDEDFKDKKVEEVLLSASEKAKATFEEQKTEWEKRASQSGSDELVKEWEKKYKTVEKKLSETEQARLDAINSFESFKVEVSEKEKRGKVESVFNTALNAIKFDPTVNDFTKKGFIATINEKYLIDLEETGDAVVKDRKTGERIKNKDKAGTFLGVQDVLLSEATQAGIIMKNPNGGRPNTPIAGYQPSGQQQPQTDPRLKGVSPRFLQS